MTMGRKSVLWLGAILAGLLVSLAAPILSRGTSTVDEVVRIVEGLAQGNTAIEIAPMDLVARLKPLAALKSEGADEYVWAFSGSNPEGGVARAEVEFQPAEPGSSRDWTLLQVRLSLVDEGYKKGVFRGLREGFSGVLGSPLEVADDSGLWGFGDYGVVALRRNNARGVDEGEAVGEVAVEIAVEQGEP
jgi:hypothetical protein